MENKKFVIMLAIFLIAFTIVKNFAPFKYFVLFIVLLPFIVILLGIYAFKKNK